MGELSLDLSTYDGIELAINVLESDSKRYTFILKDKILPKNDANGREQATISWEYDFVAPKPESNECTDGELVTVFIPWRSFEPTYRGKPKEDAGTLDNTSLKRFSIMMRRYDLPLGCQSH